MNTASGAAAPANAERPRRSSRRSWAITLAVLAVVIGAIAAVILLVRKRMMETRAIVRRPVAAASALQQPNGGTLPIASPFILPDIGQPISNFNSKQDGLIAVQNAEANAIDMRPCKPRAQHVGEFKIIGMDLKQAKAGDLLLSCSMGDEQEKMAMLSKLAFFYGDETPTKTWKNRTLLQRFPPDVNVIGKSLIDSFIGDHVPSHAAMIGFLHPEVNLRTAENTIVIDYTVSDGKRQVDLATYLSMYPSSKSRMWYVQTTAPEIPIRAMELYYAMACTSGRRLGPFSSYIGATPSFAQFVSRDMFFKQVRGASETSTSTAEPAAFCSYMAKHSDKIHAMCKEAVDAYILVGNKLESPDQFVRVNKCGPNDISVSVAGTNEWRGLATSGFTCGSLAYAILEAWGTVVPVSPPPNFLYAADGSRCFTQPAGAKLQVSEFADNGVRGAPNDHGIRLVPPSRFMPSEYTRIDCAWNDGHVPLYASPVLYIKSRKA